MPDDRSTCEPLEKVGAMLGELCRVTGSSESGSSWSRRKSPVVNADPVPDEVVPIEAQANRSKHEARRTDIKDKQQRIRCGPRTIRPQTVAQSTPQLDQE